MTTTTTRNGNFEVTADWSKSLLALKSEATKHGKQVILAKASAEPVNEDQAPPLTDSQKSNIQQFWDVMPEEDKLSFLKEKFADNRVKQVLREVGFKGLELK